MERDFLQIYKARETEDLLDLYLTGDLVEDAFLAIVEELNLRSLTPYKLYQFHDLSNFRKTKESLEREISLLVRERALVEKEIARKSRELGGDSFSLSKYVGLVLKRKQLELKRKNLEEVERIKKL